MRNALKTAEAPRNGLGSRVAAGFKRIGLRAGEELTLLRGDEIKSPFDE